MLHHFVYSNCVQVLGVRIPSYLFALLDQGLHVGSLSAQLCLRVTVRETIRQTVRYNLTLSLSLKVYSAVEVMLILWLLTEWDLENFVYCLTDEWLNKKKL